LKQTFSLEKEHNFDDEFKKIVENKVYNHDFKKHKYDNKDLFDMKDLNCAIKSLKKSQLVDRINNVMIQNTSQEFRKIILLLINETVKQSIITHCWKESMISMIPKKQNNSSNPKDYRPISLTSCIAKLAERLILSRIKEFMDKNKIIMKQQSGFRKQRQTRGILFFLTQKAIESVNRGEKMVSIFF
jgi:hypothetical protein